MVETDEQVLQEIKRGGESLVLEDVLLHIERHHPHTQPGVSSETIDAYAKDLSEDRYEQFDVDAFEEGLNSRLTDSKTWTNKDAIYELDSGRISRYPATWHNRLGDTTEIPKYIAFLQDEVPEFKDDIGLGGASQGIPEQPLLDIVAVVGQADHSDVKAQLEDLRDQGIVAEDADQHPNAGVVLSDRHEEYRDPSLDE